MRIFLFILLFGASLAYPETVSAPLSGMKVSSVYGPRFHPLLHTIRKHDGVDLSAEKGSPIRALGAGRVVFTGEYAGYGNLIVIAHTSSVTSHYGHCETISVRAGAKVKSGDTIGTVGTTGHVTGPHLHLEIRVSGRSINPAFVLRRTDRYQS